MIIIFFIFPDQKPAILFLGCKKIKKTIETKTLRLLGYHKVIISSNLHKPIFKNKRDGS